jgi:medium-chain acyl-[acyl-carrier-protein] hydrolase
MTTNTTWTTPWIASPAPERSARLRLFCFPYAGGGAAVFRPWHSALPPGVVLHPVQLPGRENRLREPPFTRIDPLVRDLAGALLPMIDRPFACFGHSLGALIAFEFARYLRRHHGLTPQCLFVSAHRAPQLPNPEPDIYRLPEAEFLEKLRSLNGTPDVVLRDPELMALMLPTLRADFTVCGTYRYVEDAPLDCPIKAFGGLDDPLVGREQLSAWHDQTRTGFSLHLMRGDHFFLHKERQQLLAALSDELS